MRTNSSSQDGMIVRSLIILLVLLLLAGFFIFYIIFGYTIPSDYIGVRQIKLGPGFAFSKVGLQPGLHWGLPYYTVVHLVPETIQALHFHREEGDVQSNETPPELSFTQQAMLGVNFPTLEIQTADRATVDVDLTILARFFPEPRGPGEDAESGGRAHGGPADLVQKLGVTPDSWHNHIRRTAEDQLKRALGTISTGEFYDPHKREKALEVAQQKMREVLEPDGVAIEALLLRRYTYRDERIDQAIFQKNLQDQEERLNVQGGKLAEAQAALEQVAAEWDAKMQTLRVQGENRARVLRSEGDLYEKEKSAHGDLEVAKAQAEIDRLRSGALAGSAGAPIYVARELTGLLTSIKGGVISGVDPYDLKSWMEKLGVTAEEGR